MRENAYQKFADPKSSITVPDQALETLPQTMRERQPPLTKVSDVLTTSEPLVPVAPIAPRVGNSRTYRTQPCKYGLTLPRHLRSSVISGVELPTEFTF